MEEIHMYDQHNIMYQVPTTNGFCEFIKVNIDQEVEKTEDPFSVSETKKKKNYWKEKLKT